jgi:N-acetylmuramoyl-L-alanine amidase
MRLLFGLLFFATAWAQSQSSLPVEFSTSPARNAHIASFARGNVLYGSLNDLSQVLSLKISPNAETQKLAIQSDQYTVKVTAENPFIVLTDRNRNASIVQLSASVVFSSGSYFIPAEEFAPILQYIYPSEVSFNHARSAFVIGTAIPPSAFDITGLRLEQKSNGSLMRIRCSRKLNEYESWLKPAGENTWLYVTIANARADVAALSTIKPSGILKQALVFQSPTSVQLTFKLKGDVTSTELIPAEGSDDILLAIHTPTEEQIASRKARTTTVDLTKERDKWKMDVVVIDAGHGGDDPGTIGVNRTKEKDITLAIALKLGKVLEKKMPDVKVVYTRKKDEFIELYRRGQIANQAGGKLFISIHCNSVPHHANRANGYEIYLLRPGKTENALRIAERENSAIKLEQGYEQRYQQLTEENFILLSMAQSAYVKYSELFADILQKTMGKNIELQNDGVKQAGFYVLVGASMPNVLVETAYLSNKHDEKILRSTRGQQRIAEAIFNAVQEYKNRYEKSLEEGGGADGTR